MPSVSASQKYGLDMRTVKKSPASGRRLWTDEHRAKVVAALDRYPVSEVCTDLGIAESLVRGWRDKAQTLKAVKTAAKRTRGSLGIGSIGLRRRHKGR